MRFSNLDNFKRNWIVGDFEPSLFKSSDNDIGILYVERGDRSDFHFHKHHTEYNIIVKGKVQINSEIYKDKDIFIYEPFEKSDVHFLEDTIIVVIKNPSTINDKFYDTDIT